MTPRYPRSTALWLLAMAALAAAYAAVGLTTVTLFPGMSPAMSPVWPAAGIAIAALLLWGRRLWPGIAVGSFLVHHLATGNLAASLILATGDTVAALLAATLVLRTIRAGGLFDSLHNVGRYVMLAGLLAPMLSAIAGIVALLILGDTPQAQAGPQWLAWWLANVVGALAVGPAIILWVSQWRSGWQRGSMPEWLAATLAAPAIAAVLFHLETLFGTTPHLPLSFLVVPTVVWVAYRFGPRDASTSTLLVAVVASYATLSGSGPFVGYPLATTQYLLAAFLAVLAITSLGLAAMSFERRRAEEGLELRVRERTERLEKTLEDLRHSQARLAEAQATARLGSWDWDLTRDRIHWSREMYNLLGRDPDSFAPTFTSYSEAVHPDDREAFESGAKLAIERKGPFTVAEHRIILPDGQIRWVRGEGAVALDEQGAPVRVYGTSQDITERRRAEIQFQAIVQSAPDAIISADEAGFITMANSQAERMFGYEHDELLGLRVEALVPERFQARHVNHRAEYHKNPNVRPMGTGLDLRGRRKDSSEFPVEISLSPLQTESGTQVAAIIRDVTVRQQVAEADRIAFARLLEIEKLKEMDRFKTQVLNTASHELNTPITPLKLQIHLLKNVLGELNEDQERAVSVLDRNVDRLASLVSDVLDVARLQSDSLQLTLGPADVGTLAHEAVETFEEPARQAGVSIELECGSDLMTHGDVRRISQVLYNLISNAVKFSPPKTTIQMRCQRVQDLLRVEVQDQGPGLERDQIERLFQPFSQVHERTPDSPTGTGLGLYICKGIVEQHGGQIGVDSAGHGRGTTFWFTIPFIAPVAQEKAESGAHGEGEAGQEAIEESSGDAGGKAQQEETESGESATDSAERDED